MNQEIQACKDLQMEYCSQMILFGMAMAVHPPAHAALFKTHLISSEILHQPQMILRQEFALIIGNEDIRVEVIEIFVK